MYLFLLFMIQLNFYMNFTFQLFTQTINVIRGIMNETTLPSVVNCFPKL